MKPFIHAKNSAIKFGGAASDYVEIHNFMDSSKAIVPDMRHRAIFHSAFGCFIVEKVFGLTIKNSDGEEVSTRDIAEEHILEDLGMIPTLQDWLNEMQFKDWMMSPDIREKNRKFPLTSSGIVDEPIEKNETNDTNDTNDFDNKPNDQSSIHIDKSQVVTYDPNMVFDGSRPIIDFTHPTEKELDEITNKLKLDYPQRRHSRRRGNDSGLNRTLD